MPWRSGSRPWTLCSCPWTRCMTYHGASCNNNLSLCMDWSCIYVLVLCNRGFDHDCSSLIPFLGQVQALVFGRSMHLPNLYFDLPSSITPWYLEDIMSLHYILWILDEVMLFPVIVTPRVLGCHQPRTSNSESSPHCNSTTRSKLLCLRVCTRSCHSQLIGYLIIVMLKLDHAT
jgi:hypothetical protein